MSSPMITKKSNKESDLTWIQDIFADDKYEIIDILGDGRTSTVYLAQERQDSSKKVAIKVFDPLFVLLRDDGVKAVKNELLILMSMDHKSINKSQGYGSKKFEQGDEQMNLIYLILDFVPGGQILFDTITYLTPMGEEGGRFFMN